IRLEGHYNIGTEIEIAGVKGEVKKINLRTTVLKADKGILHIIPNSSIAHITIINKGSKKGSASSI
ncbi:mechanosensitive ion channel family protein, partial [Patescibacteria group bacterium]|nr:mechanosensitive ion channel family protein [Patescibacteria group bacterium]